MKKVLLFGILLLLTGCSTEVTLKIDLENISETIRVYELKDIAYPNNILNDDIKSNMEAFEREYEFYDMNEFEDQDYVSKTYEFSESIELWSELSHLRPCYEKFQLVKTATNISLETSDEYRCGYLFGANDVVLTVESDLKLINSNADEVKENKLIWYINDSNYQNKNVSFNYQIDYKSNEPNLEYLKYVFFIIISGLIVGVLVFIKKRNEESNKI